MTVSDCDRGVLPMGELLEENLKKALTELMLLYMLSQKDSYIGELTERLHRDSKGALSIVFPYAAIYRMLQSGYIYEKEKKIAPDGRRRQFYAITDGGREYLASCIDAYGRFTRGISDVLFGEENDK